mmetsp:Transcript_11720/g.33146  ORF Transcript_11720/g.33146 Transcript_11720/m.33146 type:complete len:208 (-) Transcript_11720:264-887(-)
MVTREMGPQVMKCAWRTSSVAWKWTFCTTTLLLSASATAAVGERNLRSQTSSRCLAIILVISSCIFLTCRCTASGSDGSCGALAALAAASLSILRPPECSTVRCPSCGCSLANTEAPLCPRSWRPPSSSSLSGTRSTRRRDTEGPPPRAGARRSSTSLPTPGCTLSRRLRTPPGLSPPPASSRRPKTDGSAAVAEEPANQWPSLMPL